MINRLKERVSILREDLSESAGENPTRDRYIVGVIAGYNDLINIDFEEESPNED